MASIKFEGVLFVAYPQDHEPGHVHGFYAETEAIVNLTENGRVAVANRRDAIRPPGAKVSNVRKIVTVAAGHVDELILLWERMHA